MIDVELNEDDKVLLLLDNEKIETTYSDAVSRAEEAELDIIVVDKNDKFAVVKIGNLEKELYYQKKKQKRQEKNQRKAQTKEKEIKFTPDISQHDIDVKVNKVNDFLKRDIRVTLTIMYKGRMINILKDEGIDKLTQIVSQISEKYKLVKEPSISGNKVIAIIEQG